MPLRYRLLRWLAQILLSLFYRRFEVVGAEHVPSAAPLLVIANHQNALIDPMLLLAALPRRLVPIAKAPLFRHPLISPFLYLVGAIPVHRRQDAGEEPPDLLRNRAMFAAAVAALRGGDAVLLFPEGVSQPEPRLMPLRSGAARLVFAAAADGIHPAVLPVGLVYQRPEVFRAGWALVLIGRPISTNASTPALTTAPAAAVRTLTGAMDVALRELIVEARDRDTLRLVELADRIWRADTKEPHGDPARRAEWRRRAMLAWRHLSDHEPERVARFRAELELYAARLEAAGLTGREPEVGYPIGLVLRYAIREGTALAFGLPLALVGILIHALPYQGTALAVRALRPEPDTEATYKVAAGLVLYPLCWLAEAWLVWRLGGAWLAAGFLACLGPAGLVALTWRSRLARVGTDARGLARFLLDRDLYRNLLERRRALLEEMRALAARVPDDTLTGEPRP
jgi:1-acyl-sn-glycerol-3-phosphate acyltransferase